MNPSQSHWHNCSCSSQTACHCHPTINQERLLATATPPATAPAPAHNSNLIANHGNVVNLSPSHPALSPLMRMTGTEIYPALPMHTTGNPTTMLPQPYVRPGPVVAGLLSHAFNPNAFLGDPPESSAPVFVGANTTGHKKASILRMTLGKGQAPICHILIYPFLLAHNMDLMKPKIPGLKSDNLDSLTFKNMGWCFLQLVTRKPYHALLTYNKKHTGDQSNLSYMIQYASLESKFNKRQKKKPLSMPRQFTIVIALREYLTLYETGFMPVLWNGPCTTSDSSYEAMVAGAMKTNYLAYVHAEASALTNSEETFQLITVSQIVLIGAVPMLQHSGQGHSSPIAGPQCAAPVWSLSPIRPVELDVLPLPAPHYASLIWPDCVRAELAQCQQFASFYTQLVDEHYTIGLDTMALTGPSIEALADAILTLCLFVAKNGWDAPNKRFHEFIDNWQGPEFSTPDITVIVEPSSSHGAGINKIVFREALLKAMRDTDLYSALPNNSPYFTAKFPMAGMTTSQRIQWRVQGLLLTICTVTFRMPPLPISPFLFLALVLETPQIPHVLDALTSPVVRALDPACEAFMEPWLGHRLNELLTTEPAKNWGRDPRYLWVTHFCEPHLTLSIPGFGSGIAGPRPGKSHTSEQSSHPTIQDDLNDLLEYLESNYDRNIHSIDALMEVIQIKTSTVGTDAFCSRRCDWGFSKDENGWDLPLYISAKKAFQVLPANHNELALYAMWWISYKVVSTSMCFTIAKVKLDDDLCTLLSGCSTEVFPDFAACLDLWLSNNSNIVTTI
ncbi:hypothetical protein F5146DRAFT_1004385 [Armillaria mellea]|nr:hypothetical protein F5146DRAFT_1004385 [Armillaria mellea]